MGKYITKQRRILLEYLNSHKDELLTTNDIVAALKKGGISESAVYRNLSALLKSGEIIKVKQGENKETVYRFSGSHSECKDAIHLSCKNCGKMFHLKADTEKVLKQNVSDSEDFQIDCSNTVLYGICSKCKKVKV